MELKVNLTEKEEFVILNALMLYEKEYPEEAKIANSAYHKIFDADLETWCRKQGIEKATSPAKVSRKQK